MNLFKRTTFRTLKRLAACAVLTAGVSACQTTDSGPNIGSGTDDYQESKCACAHVPQKYKSQFAG